MKLPEFENISQLHKHLIANKSILIAAKKMQFKKADAVINKSIDSEIDNEITTKAIDVAKLDDINKIQVKSVMNTTMLMDSHGDVHIDGIWNKTIRENKNLMLLKEHKQNFEDIISTNIKAYTRTVSWKSLGFDFEGNTQALMFDSEIERERNEYMFKQYAKGYVTNHSVGMQYVKLELAINNKDYSEEYAVYKEYIDQIANKSTVEKNGYFWAVKEAKLYEGSAVVLGSNFATPTMSVNEKSLETNEPLQDTQEQKPTKKTSIYSLLIQ